MKKTQIIRVDMINRDVIFHFGTIQSLQKVLRRYHTDETIAMIIEDAPEGVKGWTRYMQNPYTLIVWMPSIPKTAEDMSFLSHEIFHAAVALMNSIGASLSADSEEAYAYLIGFLTRKVIEGFSISFDENHGQGLVLEQPQPKS